MKSLLLSLLLLNPVSAQIYAKFNTNLAVDVGGGNTVSDFTVELNHLDYPLATTNFMLLSGLEADVWTAVASMDTPAFFVQYSATRPGNPYTQFGRVSLNVLFQEPQPGIEGDINKYIVRQGSSELGRVSFTPDADGVYNDLSGDGIVEIHSETNPNNDSFTFTIQINHKRNWFDNDFGVLRDDTRYRNIRITEVDIGRRFFAGTSAFDPILAAQESLGYRFPDEITPNRSTANPWGNRFSTRGYVLAMDNQQQNTNGSRFFITGRPLPGDLALMREWDRRFTPLGEVIFDGGQLVVNEILSSGAVGTNIISIEISRRGDTDQGFFPHLVQEEDLPGQIQNLPLRIERNGSSIELVTPATPSSQQIFMSSTDLEDEFVSFSNVVPFEFDEVRTDLTSIIETQPRAFFQAFSAPVPSWDSLDFDFSRANLQFHNINENGNASGSVIFFLGLGDLISGSAFSANYQLILPAKTVAMQDGTTTNFPQISQVGTVSGFYNADTNPYSAQIDIFSSSGGAFPFEFMFLNFDYRRGTELDSRISRFTAGNRETGYGINGIWQRTN